MNCPICARELKIRYDTVEFTVVCDTKIKNMTYSHTTEMSHFNQSITWLDNVKVRNTSFVLNDMIFYSRLNNTIIYELWTNKVLLCLPKEILPETVNIEKIKALLLFS